MKQIIATIVLDTVDERRAPIKYRAGRILCEGEDITPDHRNVTREQAQKYVCAMYGTGFPWFRVDTPDF